ncbi:hypothetical protein NVS55_30665 [Myxococcus stipitatus]|uniref:hypothetical protein n=1 Tax=Myxococcus stipitatus TaxID=83455 RepID=UPI00314553A8
MEPNHRRQYSLTTTLNVPRQTPHNDFGTTLAHAANTVVSKGAGLVGGMIPSPPVLSAAVSSMKLAVSTVASKGTPAMSSSGATVSGSTASGAGTAQGSSSGGQDGWDLLEAQRALSADGQRFNAAYLQLQNEMQRESREHNAVSNIMKVRHDSAKAAINNIR